MIFMWKQKSKLLTRKKISDDLLKEIIYKGCYKRDKDVLSHVSKRFLSRKRINSLFKEAYARNIFQAPALLIMHQASLAHIDSKYRYPNYQVEVLNTGKCIIF